MRVCKRRIWLVRRRYAWYHSAYADYGGLISKVATVYSTSWGQAKMQEKQPQAETSCPFKWARQARMRQRHTLFVKEAEKATTWQRQVRDPWRWADERRTWDTNACVLMRSKRVRQEACMRYSTRERAKPSIIHAISSSTWRCISHAVDLLLSCSRTEDTRVVAKSFCIHAAQALHLDVNAYIYVTSCACT